MDLPKYTQDLISKDYNNKPNSQYPIETKRDTTPFSGQLPYNTTPKMYNYQGYRPAIAKLTNPKGNSVCFNTELSKTPFYERSFGPANTSRNVDTSQDPRYKYLSYNFSNQYKHT